VSYYYNNFGFNVIVQPHPFQQQAVQPLPIVPESRLPSINELRLPMPRPYISSVSYVQKFNKDPINNLEKPSEDLKFLDPSHFDLNSGQKPLDQEMKKRKLDDSQELEVIEKRKMLKTVSLESIKDKIKENDSPEVRKKVEDISSQLLGFLRKATIDDMGKGNRTDTRLQINKAMFSIFALKLGLNPIESYKDFSVVYNEFKGIEGIRNKIFDVKVPLTFRTVKTYHDVMHFDIDVYKQFEIIFAEEPKQFEITKQFKWIAKNMDPQGKKENDS